MADYTHSTIGATLGAPPDPIQTALLERATAVQLTLAPDARAYLTHSRRLRTPSGVTPPRCGETQHTAASLAASPVVARPREGDGPLRAMSTIERTAVKGIHRNLASPAMIVACVALIVALGGVGYAAGVLPTTSVGTAQLQKKAVTSAKLKSNAVTAAKVKNGSLSAADFKAGQLPAGPQGLAGP